MTEKQIDPWEIPIKYIEEDELVFDDEPENES